MPKLPPGTRFVKGPGFKKYTAIIPDHGRVSFGDKRYQQFKDSVPKRLGGGLYSNKDHGDAKRRLNYRRRHGAQGYYKKPLTPAWFSWFYLW